MRTLCGWRAGVVALGGLLLPPLPVRAQGDTEKKADHTSLQENHPLEVDDPSPIPFGVFQWQPYFRYTRTSDHQDQFRLVPRVDYGFSRNWEIVIEAPFLWGNADRRGSGNLRLSPQWQFKEEQGRRPGLALALQTEFPSGEQSAGVDIQVKFLLSQSLGDEPAQPKFYFNAAWKNNAAVMPEERSNGSLFILGYSRRLNSRTTFLADFVRDEDPQQGQTHHILELGLRRQAGARTVWSVGIGAGIGQDAPPFRAMLGMQHAF